MGILSGNIIALVTGGVLFGSSDAAGDYAGIEPALVGMMKADGSVSAIVGTKIFPNIVPHSASMPSITYQLIDSGYEYALDSTPSHKINLVTCRYQVNCWAATYKAARQLADKVRALFDGYAGTVGGVPIRKIQIADESDISEPEELESLKRFGKRIDLMVWYHEQV